MRTRPGLSRETPGFSQTHFGFWHRATRAGKRIHRNVFRGSQPTMLGPQPTCRGPYLLDLWIGATAEGPGSAPPWQKFGGSADSCSCGCCTPVLIFGPVWDLRDFGGSDSLVAIAACWGALTVIWAACPGWSFWFKNKAGMDTPWAFVLCRGVLGCCAVLAGHIE